MKLVCFHYWSSSSLCCLSISECPSFLISHCTSVTQSDLHSFKKRIKLMSSFVSSASSCIIYVPLPCAACITFTIADSSQVLVAEIWWAHFSPTPHLKIFFSSDSADSDSSDITVIKLHTAPSGDIYSTAPCRWFRHTLMCSVDGIFIYSLKKDSLYSFAMSKNLCEKNN